MQTLYKNFANGVMRHTFWKRNSEIKLKAIESQIFKDNKAQNKGSSKKATIYKMGKQYGDNIKWKLNSPSHCSSLTEVQKFGRLLPLHNVRLQGRFLRSLGSMEVFHAGERYILLDLDMSGPEDEPPRFSRFQNPIQNY